MTAQDQPVIIQRDYRSSVLVWLRLVRIYNRLSREHANVPEQYGLTVPQFDMLSQIATHPGLSQQALAGRMLVTKGNICGLADRLEIAGLIERRPDPNDRRSNQIYLTTQGQDVFRQAAPAVEGFLETQFAVLDDEELHMVMHLMSRVDRSLQKERS